MENWKKGYQMVRISIPHLRRAKTAAAGVKKGFRKEERKRNPFAGISHIARVVETLANLVLLILAVVSLLRAFSNIND